MAGTPLAEQPDLTPEFVRTVAVACITMPKARVRLSAGRQSMSEAVQALCHVAGANSIFYGDKLPTTPNPRAMPIWFAGTAGPAHRASHSRATDWQGMQAALVPMLAVLVALAVDRILRTARTFAPGGVDGARSGAHGAWLQV